VRDPVFEVDLRDRAHRIVFATSSRWAHGPTGSFRAGESCQVRVRFHNYLVPGPYSLSASARGRGGELLEDRPELAELTVFGPRQTRGVADLPHEFDVSRS
jgi:hypothetical protein